MPTRPYTPNHQNQQLDGQLDHLVEIARLKNERDRFEALVDLSSEGFTVFDAEATIVYESHTNERITGYSKEEMQGRNLLEFIHENDKLNVQEKFQNVLQQSGKTDSAIVRFRHRDGHWIYLHGTIVNQLDDPRISGIINNFRDVTDRIRLEQNLRNAKEKAEAAQRLQTEFLTNFGHEFKTPITLIREPLRQLAESYALDTTDNNWALMERNIKRLEQLIDELAELAYLEDGSTRLHMKPGRLSQCINKWIEEFKPSINEKALQIKVTSKSETDLFFDQYQIGKTFQNIFKNAIRFSPQNGLITITIDTDNSVNGNPNYVRVAVRDVGPGVDSSHQDKLFERFYQVSQGNARKSEGMGVGLAIAKDMVELHGGDIGIDSELGFGATVWFRLPLGAEHLVINEVDIPSPIETNTIKQTPIASPPQKNSIASDDAPKKLPPKQALTPPLEASVLLVEDNADMREFLSMHLAKRFTTNVASNGKEALHAIKQAIPDIILSDVMMPEMDGIELCKRLRAQPSTAPLPVILLSAKDTACDRSRGIEAGADDYMVKPFLMRELIARIESRLPQTLQQQNENSAPSPAHAKRWLNLFKAEAQAGHGIAHATIPSLARKMGLSERQLQRRCKEYSGYAPSDMLRRIRLELARDLLIRGETETIAEAAHQVGFSPNYLSRLCRAEYGCAPSELIPKP